MKQRGLTTIRQSCFSHSVVNSWNDLPEDAVLAGDKAVFSHRVVNSWNELPEDAVLAGDKAVFSHRVVNSWNDLPEDAVLAGDNQLKNNLKFFGSIEISNMK